MLSGLPFGRNGRRMFPILNGPLRGEQHDQGESFRFDGTALGLESGTYRLTAEGYLWCPAEPLALDPGSSKSSQRNDRRPCRYGP